MVGERLGHYRVLERVGAGAMGVVYRAHDERLDRQVAIKVLAGSPVDAAARARLLKEARAISRAVHPTIATVHDLSAEGDLDFLVMELVPGPTLATRVAESPLPERDVVALGEQLAAGLAAAHAAGVIHRDIKPSNLKLMPDGGLKILDFGIAQLRATETDTTKTGTMPPRPAGTLPYMAPEQLAGAVPDARTDVYAAGAVLYEMATGQRAFPQLYEGQLIEAVLRRPPVAPRSLRPELSEALERCVLKALQKDPVERYQSAADFRRDLLSTATAVGVQLAPATRRAAAAALFLRYKAVWLSVALVIIIATGVSRSFVGLSPSPAAPTPGTAKTSTGTVRLAVLPPQNLTRRPPVDAWLPLVQSLFTSELTGVQDLGVIDPLSLNGRIRLAGGSPGERENRLAETLAKLGVTMTVDNRIVPAGGAFQLQANLVDPQNSEVRFTAREDIAAEEDLPRAVRAAARSIVSYLQLQVFNLAGTLDMRPWITLKERNIEAVKAFVQANQYIFRFQLAEVEALLRRAVDIDPAFIAPRIWLTQQLFDKGNVAEAQVQYAELKQLEPTASPFEQAMIGFAGAMLTDDAAGQIRYLEIALDYSPGNNILLVNLAYARARSGDCPRALRDLDPAVDSRWEFPVLYSLWGACAIRIERFEDARRVLTIGSQLPTVDPHVYALLAGLEAAFGAASTAERLEAQFVARQKELKRPVGDPALAEIYDLLGRHRLDHGDRGRASVLFSMRDRLRAAEDPAPRRP